MQLVDAKCSNCGAILKVEKDSDAAICQYCNSAFIVEKAINNFNTYISNSINISGEQLMELASQGTLQENLEVAKRARLKEVWDEAENAYRIVEKKQPDNIEAFFYSEFSRVKQNLRTQNVLNRNIYFESLNNAIRMMAQYQKDNDEEVEVFKNIYHDLEKTYDSQYVVNVANKSADSRKTNDLFKTTSEALIYTTVLFINKCNNEVRKEEYKQLVINHIIVCRKHGLYLKNEKAIVNEIAPNGIPNSGLTNSDSSDSLTFLFVLSLVASFVATIFFRSVSVGGILLVISIIIGIILIICSMTRKEEKC